jgi:hypothetical protein
MSRLPSLPFNGVPLYKGHGKTGLDLAQEQQGENPSQYRRQLGKRPAQVLDTLSGILGSSGQMAEMRMQNATSNEQLMFQLK